MKHDFNYDKDINAKFRSNIGLFQCLNLDTSLCILYAF